MTLRKRAVKKVQLWLLRRISGGKSVVLNIRYLRGEIEVTRGGEALAASIRDPPSATHRRVRTPRVCRGGPVSRKTRPQPTTREPELWLGPDMHWLTNWPGLLRLLKVAARLSEYGTPGKAQEYDSNVRTSPGPRVPLDRPASEEDRRRPEADSTGAPFRRIGARLDRRANKLADDLERDLKYGKATVRSPVCSQCGRGQRMGAVHCDGCGRRLAS